VMGQLTPPECVVSRLRCCIRMERNSNNDKKDSAISHGQAHTNARMELPLSSQYV
jgi:hypothetical protein